MRAIIHLVVRAAVAATAQAQQPGVPTAGVRVRTRWGDFESFPRRAIVALLRPMPFTNGSGDTAPLHAGDVQLRVLK